MEKSQWCYNVYVHTHTHTPHTHTHTHTHTPYLVSESADLGEGNIEYGVAAGGRNDGYL